MVAESTGDFTEHAQKLHYTQTTGTVPICVNLVLRCWPFRQYRNTRVVSSSRSLIASLIITSDWGVFFGVQKERILYRKGNLFFAVGNSCGNNGSSGPVRTTSGHDHHLKIKPEKC